jgi:hypothetical protein
MMRVVPAQTEMINSNNTGTRETMNSERETPQLMYE